MSAYFIGFKLNVLYFYCPLAGFNYYPVILLIFRLCHFYIKSFFLMVLIHALDDFCSSERLGCFINNNAYVVLNKY